MNVLLSKFDEAIDDLENGRVLTEKELWEEIDSIYRIGCGNKRLQNRNLGLTDRNGWRIILTNSWRWPLKPLMRR